MNLNLRIIAIFSAILCVSACNQTSNYAMSGNATNFSSIAPAAGYEPQTFKDYLAIEYRNLADYEQNTVYDYKSAKHYIKKVEKLENGQMVAPDHYKSAYLTPEYKAELKFARETLMKSIKDYPYPENRAALALAQTRYDCWLDQAEAWPENPERLTCKQQFNENMGLLYRPEIEYLEGYGFDRI